MGEKWRTRLGNLHNALRGDHPESAINAASLAPPAVQAQVQEERHGQTD